MYGIELEPTVYDSDLSATTSLLVHVQYRYVEAELTRHTVL